jgi:hypothetical protein
MARTTTSRYLFPPVRPPASCSLGEPRLAGTTPGGARAALEPNQASRMRIPSSGEMSESAPRYHFKRGSPGIGSHHTVPIGLSRCLIPKVAVHNWGRPRLPLS